MLNKLVKSIDKHQLMSATGGNLGNCTTGGALCPSYRLCFICARFYAILYYKYSTMLLSVSLELAPRQQPQPGSAWARQF